MIRLLTLLIFSICIASCTEEESPKPDSSKLSTVVGDHIYTIIGGNNQSGYPGVILSEEIKIVVTDLNGEPVFRPLQIELSDNSGKVFNYYYSGSDTISFRWKLGCDLQEQMMTVKDNVCDLAKSGCIDAKIFSIGATVTDNITSGWYSPCTSFNEYDHFYNTQFLVADERVVAIFGDRLYSTSNPVEPNWIIMNAAISNQSNEYFSILSNGEVFLSGSNSKISNWSDANWKDINLPISYGQVGMEVSENGIYFFASEHSSLLYSSQDLNNWSTTLNIGAYGSYNNSKPQAIAADGNDFYILTGGKFILKVDATSGSVNEYEFPPNSWSIYSDINDFQVEVMDDVLFMFSPSEDLLKIFDLSMMKIENYNNERYSRLVKSDGEIYVMHSPNFIRKWDGLGFIIQEYPSLELTGYNYTKFDLYKGAPIIVTDNDLYYYIN